MDNMNHSMMETTTMGEMDLTDAVDSHGSHKMYFHLGHHEYVLFHEAETQSVGAMVAACIVSFIVGVLYQGLKIMRENMRKKSLMKAQPIQCGRYLDNGNTEKIQGQVDLGLEPAQKQTVSPDPLLVTSSGSMFSGEHLIQTLLHMVQTLVSLCLMLVFMTYNVWLCISVVLGAGVGYLVFGWVNYSPGM